MELAGLEPATSWVRSRRATSANPLHKRVSAGLAGLKPLDTPRLPGGFGDERPSIPKTIALYRPVAKRLRTSGAVATPACHARGRGFESRRSRHEAAKAALPPAPSGFGARRSHDRLEPFETGSWPQGFRIVVRLERWYRL
jgi:hypothetical protein